jgi:hypothetical protein
MSKHLFVVLVAFAVGGCAAPKTAVIDGREVMRPTLGYTDNDLFALEHKRAWPQPRGASSGLHEHAGEMWGRVCGSDVQLDAHYRGRRLDVDGFVTPARVRGMFEDDRPVHFEARDQDGFREVIGYVGQPNVGHPYGPPVIDFKFNSQVLVGQIGWRHFNLRRDDDAWVGTVTEVGEERPFGVDGVDELWTMPAPDQVALLPFMMTCSDEHAYYKVAGPPDRDLPVSFRGLVTGPTPNHS